jgi:hypothetical protein
MVITSRNRHYEDAANQTATRFREQQDDTTAAKSQTAIEQADRILRLGDTMTIITDEPTTKFTGAYTSMYRYGLDILDADDNLLVSCDYDTEGERDRYVAFISDRRECRPQGADAFQKWERVMTYQPVPRYQVGVRNKRAARVIFEWRWM